MKRILVTGGAGFIGSHLCRRLLDEGNHVTCLDNFYTGNRSNIADFLYHHNFTLIEQDVTEFYPIIVDEIYNLACPASPVQYQKDPIYTTEIGILGALNVLKIAANSGTKILQASTSEVYGDPLIHPQVETYYGNVNPVGIRSCYDESKRCVESLFVNFYKQHKVRIKIARIFNTYGPYLSFGDGRVVSNFIIQALTNKNITIHGNGLQTRSFCYVSDTVDGLIKLMNTSDEVMGPINIGNPIETTIVNLAKLIIRITGSKSNIIHQTALIDDPIKRCPDITLAKTILNWAPEVSLVNGLTKTIKYFKECLK